MSLTQYIKDTRGEMKHVSWPTRHQVIVFTTAVVVVSLLTSVFLGAFDWLFGQAVNEVIFEGGLPTTEDLGIEVTDVSTDAVEIESPEDAEGANAPVLDIAPTN